MKVGNSSIRTIKKLLAGLINLSILFTGSAISGKAQATRVTEVIMKADDATLSGKCPMRVAFTGYITANGPGTVKYTFVRSDGATGPVHSIDFKTAGTQPVTTDWTLGDASALPFYEGWQAVKVLSPNEVESSRETGKFSITCGGTAAGQNNQNGSGKNSNERQISFAVDLSLKPAFDQIAAVDGGNEPRPVAGVADTRTQADFVENELLLMSDDQKVLNQILDRWRGKLIGTANFKQSKLNAPTGYLIRIDASGADTSNLAGDLQKISKDGGGPHRVSSEAGLKLLAVAAKERAAGVPVTANFLLYPRDIASGTTSEAGSSFSTGWSPNAFSWAYMNRGSAQNIGIGAAWQELQRRGRFGNRVRIAVLDAGFVNDADISPAAVVIGRAGMPGPGSSPFHGARVADTLMALPDNNWGAAGAAGPIADPILIDRNLDLFGFVSALGRASGAGAKIVNMSFGTTIPAVLAVAPGGLLNLLTTSLRAQDILLVAAAPNAGSFDVDALDGIAGFTWEANWDMPCENDFVICVGGMGDDTRMRDPGSAFTSRFGANATGIDIFGPFNVWVSEDPTDSLLPSVTMSKKVVGNSFASPVVAGIAALVEAANPRLSAAEVEQIVLETGQRATSPTDVPLRPDALAAVCRALGGCAPVAPSPGETGRFRVTINGFTCNRQTVDALLDDDGAKDEVFVRTDASLFDTTTNRNQPTQESLVIGDSNTRPGRIRAGSARSLGGGNGGFQSGDSFPESRTPWVRSVAPTLDRPPLSAWEGDLTRDRDALALIPSIWESDNDGRLVFNEWTSSVANTWTSIGGNMRLAISRRAGFEPTAELQAELRRLFDTVRIARGNDPKDRPIGMDDRSSHYGFTPRMLVLTYDAADRLSRTDFGQGPGIMRMGFRDNEDMRGDYVLFIQVERLR